MSYLPSAVFTPRLVQKAFIHFGNSFSLEGLLHKYCSIYAGSSHCPGPQSGSQNKDGAIFFYYLGFMEHFCDEEVTCAPT